MKVDEPGGEELKNKSRQTRSSIKKAEVQKDDDQPDENSTKSEVPLIQVVGSKLSYLVIGARFNVSWRDGTFHLAEIIETRPKPSATVTPSPIPENEKSCEADDKMVDDKEYYV
ncbi:unnamed protein product, partial [Heterosigma akashiwo]